LLIVLYRLLHTVASSKLATCYKYHKVIRLNAIRVYFSQRGMSNLGWVLFGLLAVFLCLSFTLEFFKFSQSRWVHLPIHSALEVTSSAFAFIVAYLLLKTNFLYLSHRGEEKWIASALIIMASLDGVHALLEPSTAFFWLRSSSIFIGSIFMALVWLPIGRTVASKLPLMSLVFSLVFIAFSLNFPELTPVLVEKSEFTLSFTFMNQMGGVLMLIASIRLLRTYSLEQNEIALLFGFQCILFGVSSIFLSSSTAWNFFWWESHFLRLFAHGVPLLILVIFVNRIKQQTQQTLELLQLESKYAQAQKEIEIAQATSLLRHYYENIVTALPVGILVLRAPNLQDEESLLVVDMNPAAEKTLNLRVSETQHKKLLDVFPALAMTNLPQRYLSVVQQQTVIDLGPVIYGDARLAETVYHVSAFPIDSTTLGVAFEDVSAQFRALRLKDEFVSIVSHELRTPLTSIRGAVGLVMGGALGEVPTKAKPLMQIALQNCDRLSILVNDLLDLDKMQTGKMKFQMVCTSLHQVAERALMEHQNLAEQHGLRLTYENQIEDAQVYVDPNRLMQVISNLLSNAIKFSHSGDTVQLRLIFENEQWQLEVIDQGDGISDNFKAIIFQKFSQAEAPGIRKKGGAGLGLNIAKNLIEQMGGSIGYESKEGEGSRFYIRLTPFVE
jgi:signal transduction histidine kinase